MTHAQQLRAIDGMAHEKSTEPASSQVGVERHRDLGVKRRPGTIEQRLR
jgi:hypothetical protein